MQTDDTPLTKSQKKDWNPTHWNGFGNSMLISALLKLNMCTPKHRSINKNSQCSPLWNRFWRVSMRCTKSSGGRHHRATHGRVMKDSRGHLLCLGVYETACENRKHCLISWRKCNLSI